MARWAEAIAEYRHPALIDYLQTPSGLGLLKRLARQDAAIAAELEAHASAVLKRLPAHDLPRSQLAAEVLGNAHALDEGRPIGSLVLAALRQRRGEEAHDPTEDSREESARSIWARAGIAVNELTRPALVLNVPVQSDTVIGMRGESAYLSLRQLLRTPRAWASPESPFSCAVVSAPDRCLLNSAAVVGTTAC